MGTDLLVESIPAQQFPSAICLHHSHRFVNIAEHEEFKFSCFNVRLWLYYSEGLGWDLAHQPGWLIKTYRRDRVGGFLECSSSSSSVCMEMPLPGRNRSPLTKTLEWTFLFQQNNERWWWWSKLFSLHPRKKKKRLIGNIFFSPVYVIFLLWLQISDPAEKYALCVLAKPLSGMEY